MGLTTLPTAGAKLRGGVLAAILTELRPQIAIKYVDETVNNSQVYQNDDELSLAIEANATYLAELQVTYSSNSTANLKMAMVALPAGASANAWVWQHSTDSGVNAATTGVPGIPGGAGDGWFTWSGLLVVGGIAGSATWMWAQNTANASNTIVRARSYFMLTRIG